MLFCSLSNISMQHLGAPPPDMTTGLYIRLYGRFIDMQSNFRRKKLYRTNQGSNILGSGFSNGDNVRALIQFRRERQHQHLKRCFFLKKKPIDFHINSTSVVRPVRRSKLSFSSIEINKPLPVPIHSAFKIKFKFSIQLQLLPQIRYLITLRIESSIISKDSNIPDNLIRKVINVQQEKCRINRLFLRKEEVSPNT